MKLSAKFKLSVIFLLFTFNSFKDIVKNKRRELIMKIYPLYIHGLPVAMIEVRVKDTSAKIQKKGRKVEPVDPSSRIHNDLYNQRNSKSLDVKV